MIVLFDALPGLGPRLRGDERMRGDKCWASTKKATPKAALIFLADGIFEYPLSGGERRFAKTD